MQEAELQLAEVIEKEVPVCHFFLKSRQNFNIRICKGKKNKEIVVHQDGLRYLFFALSFKYETLSRWKPMILVKTSTNLGTCSSLVSIALRRDCQDCIQ